MKFRSLDDRARDAGYSNYKHYLRSSRWREFRLSILAQTPNCHICLAAGEAVHHVDYSRLGAELAKDVVVLCESCHNELHAVNDRFKIPVWKFSEAATRVLDRLEQRRKDEKALEDAIPTHRHDIAHLSRQVRRFLAGNRSVDWMVRRLRCDKAQLEAMIVSIKAEPKPEAKPKAVARNAKPRRKVKPKEVVETITHPSDELLMKRHDIKQIKKDVRKLLAKDVPISGIALRLRIAKRLVELVAAPIEAEQKRQAAAAAKPAIVPLDAHSLGAMAPRVRKLVKAGYTAGWIAKRYEWDKAEVDSLIASIEAERAA